MFLTRELSDSKTQDKVLKFSSSILLAVVRSGSITKETSIIGEQVVPLLTRASTVQEVGDEKQDPRESD